MTNLFSKQMECELLSTDHNRVFDDWHPSEEDILKEIHQQLNKLEDAISSKSSNNVREFSANLANLSRKVFDEFGKPNSVPEIFLCSKVISEKHRFIDSVDSMCPNGETVLDLIVFPVCNMPSRSQIVNHFDYDFGYGFYFTYDRMKQTLLITIESPCS